MQLKPQFMRGILFCLCFASTMFLVYASLVPLRYRPLSWDVTWERFWQIPWLQLGIESRADWVANGLILIPSGFFAAGAVDWRQCKRSALLIASPLIVTFLVAIVVAIEFVQIWFPPRVVSQNDMAAGAIGAFVGVGLWWFAGRLLMEQIESFVLGEPGLGRWSSLINLGMLGLCMFNMMPLDLIMNQAEWQQKVAAGRVVWIPFGDIDWTFKALFFLAYAGVRIIPYSLVTALVQPARQVLLLGCTWSVLLEAVKLPLHSRTASTSNIVVGCLCVVLATFLAPYFLPIVRKLDQSSTWLIAALGANALLLVGFFSRFQRVVQDQHEIERRLQGILVVPFARAHRSSEFEAGENIALKLMVFAVVAFLLAGWCSRIGRRFNVWPRLLAVLWIVVMAVGVELGQVFVIPLIPDITDILIYVVGAAGGGLAFCLLVPSRTDCTANK